MASLREKLAPIYAPLFSEVFDRPEVVETRATCDNCAMCDQGQVAPVAMDYFKPDLKCCTYHPSLPNYLVGAILADDGDELAEGRRRLRARIAARIGVTPEYIAAPRKYNLIYTAGRGSGFFGRSKVTLCPYFDGDNAAGNCTVWRYREAVCSTYFCKYTAGKPGWNFWDVMKGYLSHVERKLARYAALTVDPKVTEPNLDRFTLTMEDVEDRPPNDADYTRFWGQWVGREEEFYIACYERVRTLGRAEFNEHVDDTPDGRGMLGALEHRYDAIASREVPKTLIRNPTMKTRHAGDNVVVTTYNPFDGFSIEKELYDVLAMFDAKQTVEQNLARLDKEHDIQLAPDLLQYLFTHGVLVAPEPPKKEKEAKEGTPPAVAAAVAAVPARVSRKERRVAKKKGKTGC